MNKTPIQELTNLINKIIPERTEKLEFGCEIECEDIKRTVLENRGDTITSYFKDSGMVCDNPLERIEKHFEILGKPISISDILIALMRTKEYSGDWKIDSTGCVYHKDKILFDINHTLPLSAPENEPAVRELIELLK